MSDNPYPPAMTEHPVRPTIEGVCQHWLPPRPLRPNADAPKRNVDR